MQEEHVRARPVTRKSARRVETLAAASNWSIPEPTCLEKEYVFMGGENASAFACNVRDFFEKHRFPGHALFVEDRVIVSLRARDEELTDNEVEAMLTIEALRNMTAARREILEAGVD